MPEDITSKHAGVIERPNRDCTEAGTNQDGSAIMTWTCKMREAANKHINRMQLSVFLATTFAISVFCFNENLRTPELAPYLMAYSLVLYMFMGGFILIIRQKTVYNYSINQEQGECESYLYFPSYAGALFNGIAILCFVAVFAVAIMMQSLIPLLGAGAVGLGYAGRLLGWKNEINHEQSKPWREHKYVTLDYKRKIIVTHFSHILYGFELRFPNQQLFDECLDFLKTVLPDDIEYLERDWDEHDAYGVHIDLD